jgi:hypothetical protein
MQICVQDIFFTNFSRLMCYDTVSWYDTTFTSLLINYDVTSGFYMHVVHTSYDTPIVSSLNMELVLIINFLNPIPGEINHLQTHIPFSSTCQTRQGIYRRV